MGTWKHIRAILLLPFMATVVIPGVLLYFLGADSLGLWQSAPATRIILPVGVGLIVTWKIEPFDAEGIAVEKEPLT